MKIRYFTSIFGLLTLLVVLIFYKNVFVATLLLLILAIIGLVFWNSRRTLFIFIFGAILGAAAEVAAVKVGVWEYAVTSFFDIPFWLILVWGNAAAFVYNKAREFKEGKLK